MKNKKNKRNIGHNKLLSSFTYMLFFLTRTGSQQLQWFRFRKGRKQRLLNQVGISGLLETCTTPNLKSVFSVLINFSSSASSVFLDHDTWPDFPSAWGWADNDHIFIFGCTYPFRYKKYVILKGSILCWRESNVVWIYIFSDCLYFSPALLYRYFIS